MVKRSLGRLTAPEDLTAQVRQDTGQCQQSRRLPCAVWAEDDHDLAWVYLDTEVPHTGNLAVAGEQVDGL